MEINKLLLIPRIFDEIGEIPNFTKELLEEMRKNREIHKGDSAAALVYSTPTDAGFKFFEEIEKAQKNRLKITKKKTINIFVDEIEK